MKVATAERQILTIIGSPRKGNTYHTCEAFAEEVTKLSPTISFEYLFLTRREMSAVLKDEN